jgi:hypothetical protein
MKKISFIKHMIYGGLKRKGTRNSCISSPAITEMKLAGPKFEYRTSYKIPPHRETGVVAAWFKRDQE